MSNGVEYDWNVVTADPAGCYVTLGDHKTGKQVGPIFICISQCLTAARNLIQIIGGERPCVWRLTNPLPMTPDNARAVVIKLHTELSDRVLQAAIELLKAEVVTTENAREVASLQEAVMFKTGKHYGPNA